MKKKDVVKSKILFNDIIQKGTRLSNKYYVVCFEKNNDNASKYGIAVGKKVGNAVTRNKVKRQIRNIITNNTKTIQNGFNYIIISKKEILNISYNEMERYLMTLLNKGEKNEK